MLFTTLLRKMAEMVFSAQVPNKIEPKLAVLTVKAREQWRSYYLP